MSGNDILNEKSLCITPPSHTHQHAHTHSYVYTHTHIYIYIYKYGVNRLGNSWGQKHGNCCLPKKIQFHCFHVFCANLCLLVFVVKKRTDFEPPHTSRLGETSIKNKWILEPPNLKAGGKLNQKQIDFLTPKNSNLKKPKWKTSWFWNPQPQGWKKFQSKTNGFWNHPTSRLGESYFPKKLIFWPPNLKAEKSSTKKQTDFETPQNLKAENNLNQKQMA